MFWNKFQPDASQEAVDRLFDYNGGKLFVKF